MTQCDGHSANTCNVEGGPFRMTPILDYEVNDFGYVACFVKGSVHIIHGMALGDAGCVDLLTAHNQCQ